MNFETNSFWKLWEYCLMSKPKALNHLLSENASEHEMTMFRNSIKSANDQYIKYCCLSILENLSKDQILHCLEFM